MSVYAESSAILAWLLDEGFGADVRRLLTSADAIVSSDLTLIECDRVLLRAAVVGELTEAEAADRRAHLMTAASHWHVLRIGPEIVERGGGRVVGKRDQEARERVLSHTARCPDCRAIVAAGLKPRPAARRASTPPPYGPPQPRTVRVSRAAR